MHGSGLELALVFLLAAVIAVPLFKRFGLGAVLGYLVAGALVGPHLLGLVGDAEETMHIAEFGIVLLLFLVGLELSPSRLWMMRRDIFGLGLLQVALCGVAVTIVVWGSTPFSLAAAIALGLPLAWLTHSIAMVPTLIVAGIALGVFVGGGFLRAQKRGRPDTWLYRQLEWRLALRYPALAALLGGQGLISRSGYWTTGRSADRGAP